MRDIVDANLTGSIALIRSTLPHLREQGWGTGSAGSSEGGQIAYPGFSLYHATKWDIEGFVEALAKEVAPFGILLTLVAPGLARAPISGAVRCCRNRSPPMAARPPPYT